MAQTGAEIFIEGEVQGVGYRYFAQRKALALGLSGYAINLRDGRVKVRVEGKLETIEEYVRDLEKGPPLARVVRLSTVWCPFTGKLRGFDIRFTEFD